MPTFAQHARSHVRPVDLRLACLFIAATVLTLVLDAVKLIVAIVRAQRLSRATMRNIRQNLFFSFLFNGIGVPIAAGILYPVAGILLSPMIAGAAMALSSLMVVLNALRLGRARL